MRMMAVVAHQRAIFSLPQIIFMRRKTVIKQQRRAAKTGIRMPGQQHVGQ